MSGRRRGEAQACGRSWSCCSRPRPPTVREPWRCRATTCPRPSRRGRRARGGSVGAAHRGPAPSAHPRHHLGIQRAPRGATRAIRRRTPRRLARAPRAGSRRPRDRRESDRGRSPPRRTTRGRPFEPPPAGAERAHRRRRGETGICRSVATTSGQSSSASRRSASASPARATTSKPAPASRRGTPAARQDGILADHHAHQQRPRPERHPMRARAAGHPGNSRTVPPTW
jgi:hypothetical protein